MDSSDPTPAPRAPLLAKHPGKIVRDEDWPIIRSLIEAGAKAPDVAKRYGISPVTINTKACKEKWATPRRVAKAKDQLAVNDPASAVAALWASRNEQSRETIYQGSIKALERFFALSPVPTSFNEALAADKLLSKAINPSGESQPTQNVAVQILTQSNFEPQPVIDVSNS